MRPWITSAGSGASWGVGEDGTRALWIYGTDGAVAAPGVSVGPKRVLLAEQGAGFGGCCV